MRTYLNRRQLISAGVGAILAVAVVAAMPATVLAQAESQRVEGSATPPILNDDWQHCCVPKNGHW
jgi:hypothetical protein